MNNSIARQEFQSNSRSGNHKPVLGWLPFISMTYPGVLRSIGNDSIANFQVVSSLLFSVVTEAVKTV